MIFHVATSQTKVEFFYGKIMFFLRTLGYGMVDQITKTKRGGAFMIVAYEAKQGLEKNMSTDPKKPGKCG